jgi:hypothetical protein
MQPACLAQHKRVARAAARAASAEAGATASCRNASRTSCQSVSTSTPIQLAPLASAYG